MQERQKLLSEAGIGVEMNATQALAIKADLAIPWYRIWVLRRYGAYKLCMLNKMYSYTPVSYRWLTFWNISIASESKQCSLTKELTGGVAGEYVHFSSADKKQTEVFRSAHFCVGREPGEIEVLDHNAR